MSPKGCAYIVERLAIRFMAMVADHERQLTEHRAAFGARTEADAKIIAGLRTEIVRFKLACDAYAADWDTAGKACRMRVDEYPLGAVIRLVRDDAERAEVAKRLIEERDALRAEVAALKSQTPKHPVKVGEWVRSVHGEVALVIKVGAFRYEIFVPGLKGWKVWHFDYCEPCDPPQTEPVPKLTHPVAVGGYLRRLTGFNTTPAGEVAQVLHVDCDAPTTEYTVKRPNGQQGVWSESGCEPCDPPAEATHDTPEGRSVAESVIRDGRKTEPKPGDTVRLVRIPSRDVVSLELQTVLEWPWIERWGTLNQIAMVVEPRYQLDGAVAVCLSTNVHARWPINCLEVVAAATHDTEAGKAAAESAAHSAEIDIGTRSRKVTT